MINQEFFKCALFYFPLKLSLTKKGYGSFFPSFFFVSVLFCFPSLRFENNWKQIKKETRSKNPLFIFFFCLFCFHFSIFFSVSIFFSFPSFSIFGSFFPFLNCCSLFIFPFLSVIFLSFLTMFFFSQHSRMYQT